MNKQMMAKNAGAHALLLPPPIQLDQDGKQLAPFSDDYWVVQEVTDAGVTVFNPRSRHTKLLHYDHIHNYTSDNEKNGARRAFLTLKVQMYIHGNEVRILPTRPGEMLAPNLAVLGIDVARPSPVSQARALATAKAFDQETERLFIASAQPFYDACASLFDALRANFEQIAHDTGWKIALDDIRAVGKYPQLVARVEGTSLQLLGKEVAINTCRGSYLLLRVFSGVLLTPDEERRRMISMHPPNEVLRVKMSLARLSASEWGFEVSGIKLSVAAAAELALEKFMQVYSRA
jgi:hypothetical protein